MPETTQDLFDFAEGSPGPFDAKAAEAAKVAAIEWTEENADPGFVIMATRAIRLVAMRQKYLTTDDVWKELGSQPREPRAIGAIMRRAAQNQLIKALPSYEKSERVQCHRRPLRQWESLIYHGD